MDVIKELISRSRREAGMFALLLVLCIWTALQTIPEAGGLLDSTFLSLRNINNVINRIGIYGIFSIGIGLVIISAGIELSVGSMMALLGIVFFFFLGEWHTTIVDTIGVWHWSLSVLAILCIGTVMGLIHGLLIAKARMQAFIVTLCGLLAYRGIARTVSEDTTKGYVLGEVESLYDWCAGSVLDVMVRMSAWFQGVPKGDLMPGRDDRGVFENLLANIPMPFVYLVIIATITYVVLHRSVYGRYLFALGRNEMATKYSGINTTAVMCSAYVICGFFTAIASILYAFYTDSVMASTHATFFELYGIAAAVLGGCSLRGGEGSIIGIVIGTAILIVLRNMVNLMGYESSLSDAITGLVIFVGVLMDDVGFKGLVGIGNRILKRNPSPGD